VQRVKLSPLFRTFLRFGLIGVGAMTVISSLVNIVATWNLIEVAEEQSLGISRNEFTVTYGVTLLIGVVISHLGYRLKK
jgi:K+-sensing histidine kinase KdpD